MGLNVIDLYSGYRQVPVLKGVNFTLNYGEIVGLIGLNGAGKSTLLKTILGLIEAQKGVVDIDGQSIATDHAAYSKSLAYIPETPILYDELTLQEHIEMTALGYGIDREEALQRAKPLLAMFRLDKYLNWFPVHFSKGMKQKVMVVCAMITDATVIIIDEPFLGLDPLAMDDFTDLLRKRAKAGAAVLFTTHVLTIAEELCDRYLLLRSGELVGQGNLTELRSQFNLPSANLQAIYRAMTEEGRRG